MIAPTEVILAQARGLNRMKTGSSLTCRTNRREIVVADVLGTAVQQKITSACAGLAICQCSDAALAVESKASLACGRTLESRIVSMQIDCPSNEGRQRVKITHMAAFVAFVLVSLSTATLP